METSRRVMVSRREGENGVLLFNGYWVTIWKDKKSSGNGGDACTTLGMYLRHWTVLLKMVKMVNLNHMCFTTIRIFWKGPSMDWNSNHTSYIPKC
jgi:hypothetical protein